MKKYLSLLFLSAFSLLAWANPVDREQAKQAAQHFLQSKGIKKEVSAIANKARLAPNHRATANATNPYYVFNIGQKEGYVIASGDDATPEILGYVSEGEFDYQQLPENMKSWLKNYENQIIALQQNPASSSLQGPRKAVRTHPAIKELLTCNWNQGSPYNDACPNYFGKGRSVTGCVATAMAQVMYYQRSKSTDRTLAAIPGYTGYTTDPVFGNLQVEGIPVGSPIDWANMRDSYNGSETAVQKKAVADLMHYCGVSVQMDYTNSSSGAQSYRVAEALKAYFGYGNSVRYVTQSSYSNESWDELCYNELANGRPFYISGANDEVGHAFVCDGYDGNRLYHINWGWGGQSNGFFLLSGLNPSQQGIGGSEGGYSQGVEAVIGFEPDNFQDMSVPFTNTLIKKLCIENWDTNADGELSYGEAGAVTTLGTVFQNQTTITSFSELRNFTSLTSIADDAFNGCSKLTSLVIPESVTSIGARAFAGCSKITSLVLPAGITSIGAEAFSGCHSLQALSLPAGITTIADGTFKDCASITSLSLPEGITAIGSAAFSGMTKLTSLYVPATRPDAITLGTNVFNGIPFTDAILTVLQGGKELFSQAEQWKQFVNIRERRVKPEFSFSPLAIDREVYLYNIGTGKFLSKGEAWGSQAIVNDEPMKFILRQDNTCGKDIYYIYSEETGRAGKYTFRTSTDGNVGRGVKAAFVDGYTSDQSRWTILSIGNNLYTIQPEANTADYTAGQYWGVVPTHKSNFAQPTYGVYWDITYSGNEQACQWAFVDFESTYAVYAESSQLERLINIAEQKNIDCTAENATLYNMKSSYDDILRAEKRLRHKLGFIHFENSKIRNICVSSFDLDLDGEVSFHEGTMVTNLGTLFYNSSITTFPEIQYFTNLTTLYGNSFEGSTLQSIELPDAITTLYYRIFYNCKDLTSISLPQFVNYIGSECFAYCPSLQTFSIAADDPSRISLSEDAFKGVDLSKLTLYVPYGSKELYANADIWKQFGTIKEMRGTTKPAFSALEPNTSVYLYNVSTGRYMNQGEAWGTQAIAAQNGLTYQVKETGLADGKYTLVSGGKYTFRTNTDTKVGEGVRACFVDGTLSSKAYWNIEPIEGTVFYTIQTPTNDDFYVEGEYLGVLPGHPSEVEYNSYGAYWDIPIADYPHSCQWAFIKLSDIQAAKSFDALCKQLKRLLKTANESAIEVSEEQAVYDNFDSTRDEIQTAIHSINEKLGYIEFENATIKTLCTNLWDEDADGELSKAEAAQVTDIGVHFKGKKMNSFNELQYFTALTSIPEYAFNGCQSLTSLYIPANVSSIGKSAFTSATNLNYVAILSDHPEQIDATGSNLRTRATIFVKEAAIPAFQADEFWGKYTNVTAYTGQPVITLADTCRNYGYTLNVPFELTGAPVAGEIKVNDPTELGTPVGVYELSIDSSSIETAGVIYKNAKLTINPATVTVTARSYSRAVGEPNPEFKVSYRGFRNRESADDVLTHQPVITCEATEESPDGVYDIIVSGCEADNYVFTYVNGTLTVGTGETAITLVEADADTPHDVYNLQGNRIATLTPREFHTLPAGIYISKGKKLIIR